MIVATCASLGSRAALLERAVASLLPQVDAVCVYLNGYAAVPRFLRHPKVLYAILSQEAGWRGDEAKCWFWDRRQFTAACAPWKKPDNVGVLFDDDLIYPLDYVECMVAALDRHPGALVGVHASLLLLPFVNWCVSRRCQYYSMPLAGDAQVHVLGTGTTAFRARDFALEIDRDFPWSYMCDIAIATWAQRVGRPLWCVARPASWLVPQRLPEGAWSITEARSGMPMIEAGRERCNVLGEVSPDAIDAENRARLLERESAALAAIATWPPLTVPVEIETNHKTVVDAIARTIR